MVLKLQIASGSLGVGLGWVPKMHTSNMIPGNAGAAAATYI